MKTLMMNGVRTCALFVAVLAGLLLMGSAVYASPPAHAPAWGHYGVAYGHLKRDVYDDGWKTYMRQDMTELREYIRDYLRRWREERGFGSAYWEEGEVARVVTNSVTDIEDDGAVLRAQVYLGDEDDEVTVWFEYGEKSSDLDEKTPSTTVKKDSEVTRTVSGLDDATRYYVRAVVQDDEGVKRYGALRSFWTSGEDDENESPEVTTRSVTYVRDDRADLRGAVDMGDYRNGTVFFVFGTSSEQVEDVADDYDRYSDIDEEDEALRKVRVDNDLDDEGTYTTRVFELSADTVYYYAVAVEYENNEGEDEILRGTVRSFRTFE
jgi:hypothetical protein